MKIVLATAVITIAATFSIPGIAADEHAHMQAQMASPMQMSDGLVKKVDKAAGKITIAHGPLANLGMPAMTMAFKVRDAAWLEKLKAGDKIRFMADNVNGALTVVHVEAVK